MGANASTEYSRDIAERQLTDYVIIGELGSGSFGRVYKCRRKRDRTKFLAAKQISRVTTDDKYMFSEPALMKSLRQKSVHFIELVDFRFIKDFAYFYAIMEYCDGGDLQRYLDENGKMSELELRTICCDAMEVMLQQGVIHRDIKPQNILLCKGDPNATTVDLLDCTVKLSDFGVATKAEILHAFGYGTIVYTAPEVLKCLSKNSGECSYDAKCDMFSLGVVMYQCVDMRLPFNIPSNIYGHESADVLPFTSDEQYDDPVQCTAELRDLLRRLLAADPSKRISADKFMSHPWFTCTAEHMLRTKIQTLKVAIITGASSGLGLHTAKALYALKKFAVVLACRNNEKASRAVAEILQGRNKRDDRLRVINLDLTCKSSIEQFATNFRAMFDRLDVLINNAGICNIHAIITNGVEAHFLSNYMGHFCLTNLLHDALSPNARIINVTCGWYHQVSTLPPFEELTGDGSRSAARRSTIDYYAASKLANCLHTVALDKQLKACGRQDVKVMTVCPCYVRGTGLYRQIPTMIRTMASPLFRIVTNNIDEGIASIVYCVITADEYLQSGMLYRDKKETKYGPNVTENAARNLWSLSERLIRHMAR